MYIFGFCFVRKIVIRMFIIIVFVLMNLKSLGDYFRNKCLVGFKALIFDLEIFKDKYKVVRDIFNFFFVELVVVWRAVLWKGVWDFVGLGLRFLVDWVF